jgi:hypothetical protein
MRKAAENTNQLAEKENASRRFPPLALSRSGSKGCRTGLIQLSVKLTPSDYLQNNHL